MLSRSSPRVAGGSSSVLPAHRRQVASGRTFRVVASQRTTPVRLASARRGELFCPGRHRPPPLYPICVNRTRTRISSSLAYAEKSTVREYASPLRMKEREVRIKKELLEPELSSSPYDTAWVAMVPQQGLPKAPRFPQCVEWILQNQQDNGSWGISEIDSSTDKSSLLSTLACIVALKKWDVGPEQIRRGLDFVGRNFSLVMDQQIAAPIGFNITFSGMISLAIEMGLEIPTEQIDVDMILHTRQMELKRFVGDKSHGRGAYMAYVAEGLGSMSDWTEVMKFQRKNGSLFNSPSTTAAALIYCHDDKALKYLNLLVSKFGSAVPTVFPRNIYCQLSMVDSLEKTGISGHFSSEIRSILDMTYSFWLNRDEEIMLDVATCAMAFRILRMNGYDVSSDELSHVAEASAFHNSLEGYVDDTKALLELCKASRVSISDNESILDNIGCWSGSLLTQKLCSGGVHGVPILEEVKYALKVPFYATMARLDHRRNIEHFDVMGYEMLKTSYLPCQVNKDLLAFAVEDFTFSQSIYQDELRHLESWVKEYRLDQLEYARLKLEYGHLSSSATIFPPELSDARILWTKHAVLTTISDDFYDVGGSKEELENLIELIERWDEHEKLPFYSERVKILFCAIYDTVNELGQKASVVQNRDVKEHMIELWLGTLRAMNTEAEWTRSQYVPTLDEYMTQANLSYALGPVVLAPMYLVGPELSESVVKHQEYDELFRLLNTGCRLLNDIQGFEREGIQGKANSVSLLVHYSGGSISTAEAKTTIEKTIASCRKDLLRLIVKEDSVVPRPCMELNWGMCKINHLFYSHTDGYTSTVEMAGAVDKVIREPLKLQTRDPSSDVRSEQ